MNNNKHSTGEWIIRENEKADGIIHLAIIAKSKNFLGGEHMVCSVTPMEYRRPIDDANAKLIRAAPELLAFAQMIANGGLDSGDSNEEIEAEARDVIYKAGA